MVGLFFDFFELFMIDALDLPKVKRTPHIDESLERKRERRK